MKKIVIIFLLSKLIFFTFAQIKFEEIGINEEKTILFNSVENFAGKQFNKTLFFGYFKDDKILIEPLTFYPEKIYYAFEKDLLYIHNRIGLYSFDFKENKISLIDLYPALTQKVEYQTGKLSEIAFSPDFRYFLAKIKNKNIKADIYLFDLVKNTKIKLIENIEIEPNLPCAIWSHDSNYFIYQKNNKLYYFSLIDFFAGKLLSENFRLVGKGKLRNATWTSDNELVWIENNIIYKADSRQFYSKAIYSKYLSQGVVIGKINFDFDPEFDHFVYNDKCKNFILVKNNNLIIYSSLRDSLYYFPYLRLKENYFFNKAIIFNNGEGIIVVDELKASNFIKKIYLIKKIENSFLFNELYLTEIQNQNINDIVSDKNEKNFVILTSKGAYCYDFNDLKINWKYEEEEIINATEVKNGWLLAGKYLTVLYNDKINILFANSFSDAGFIGNSIGVNIFNKIYLIDKIKKNISTSLNNLNLTKPKINQGLRIVGKEKKIGFYCNELYVKDLYSGKLYPLVEIPELSFKIYQPENIVGVDYFKNSKEEKYEIALLFDCIKTSEGVHEILSTLNYYEIPATFFINGAFMEINPIITQEIAYFKNVEIANMFQHYINLLDINFTLDPNFIRQGLSSNEETFYKLAGKNFSPYWHSPMYAYNETIIKYGNEAGYTFVTYNIDSLDWVGINNYELDKSYYLSSSDLIKRILENIKPGYIIRLTIGKNGSIREDWLFNNIDLLISEIIKIGYSFTTVSEIMKKYRKLN